MHALAAGGGHILENLEMACARCNLFKSDLPITSFLDSTGWSELQPLFPHLRLSERPVEDLWRANERVARLFARRPREVAANKAWNRQTREIERGLVTALIDGRTTSEFWLARSIAELREMMGRPKGGALDDNYWCGTMGLLKTFGDARRVPSAWIMPIRLGTNGQGVPGDRGFRLRFHITPEVAREFATGELLGPDPEPASVPDSDQIDWPAARRTFLP
jgi:hypothetical protein